MNEVELKYVDEIQNSSSRAFVQVKATSKHGDEIDLTFMSSFFVQKLLAQLFFNINLCLYFLGGGNGSC